ncbi:hypothetical protein ENSA5_29730 [Enhygromyxa salina]|uniref:Uncharacterized protein n=1 Tax=Enhygromyxa salina TaxID=215803 RepID=A0A2S9Y078_9BACT|nr:DUF6544 family protein [Enhygromyxa salina]PRP98503.1 hypothetical protein ENSA5_29730 [Enhygromyxa salina]
MTETPTPQTQLPDALRSFAERNILRRDYARVVLEQEGTMRLQPNASWRPFTAEQWTSAREVAFCWHARVKMAPFVTMVIDDAFEGGHGRLDVKLWGRLPVAHDDGPELDRGEAMRYLAELPWNPAALLTNPELRFAEGPEGSVRVWTGDPRTYVDAHLDEAGDIVRTYSETRSMGDAGPAPWEGRFSDYADLGGLRVPCRGEVSWLLPEGRFEYWRGEITSLKCES